MWSCSATVLLRVWWLDQLLHLLLKLYWVSWYFCIYYFNVLGFLAGQPSSLDCTSWVDMVYNNVFVASLLLQLYFFLVEYYWMHAFDWFCSCRVPLSIWCSLKLGKIMQEKCLRLKRIPESIWLRLFTHCGFFLYLFLDRDHPRELQ